MSTTHSRYEIGHHLEGLIETAMTLTEAKRTAENWASGNTGYAQAAKEVRIFDAMARRGQPEVWLMRNGVFGEWVPIRYKSAISAK